MLAKLIILGIFFVNLHVSVLSDGECPDIHGRIISPGLHYVPGPDTCTLCICENGQPKWCKAVLCSPPQDCKSFRLGNTCCEFICLDDALSKHPDSVLDGSQDFGLRLIATAVVIILFLSMLFFMVHRLRQRKLRGHQNRQMNEDQRSLASIGYIGGSLGYLSGVCEDGPSHFSSLWKPPGNYFPRGEAPPPYDEAVAQARAEAISINNMPGFHRSFPLNAATNMENLIRIENSHSPQQRSHNIQSTNDHNISQFHNNGGRLSTPFYLNNISSNHSSVGNSIADMRDRQVIVMGTNQARNFTAQHSITSSAGNNNFISTLKITSSLSAVTARNREHADFLFAATPHQGISNGETTHSSTQPRVMPPSTVDGTRQHRTIPRMLSAMDDIPAENTNFSHLKQRGLHSKSNRDIHVFRTPEDTSRHSSSSSSRMSNEINNSRLSSENATKLSSTDDTRLLIENTHRLSKENILRFGNEMSSHTQSEHQKAAHDLPRSLSEVSRQLAGEIARAETEANRTGGEVPKRQSSASLGRLLERHPLLPMPADTTPCSCSYDSEPLAVLNDDQDDYHSECENCKSANGSRYYLDESEEGSELCETMTLHRRPLPEHAAEDLHQLPTSLTLPVKTKRNRCQPGTRDAWFSSMPGTSSSEED